MTTTYPLLIAVKDAEVELNATLTVAARRKLLAELPREILPALRRRFAEYDRAYPVGAEMVKAITSLLIG